MAGSEPSDAVRVVNALLTQLDKLRQRKNVLVMATSNLPNAIGGLSRHSHGCLTLTCMYADTAFVDRADIVQFIGLPPPVAVYTILRSCLCELMQRGIVRRAVRPCGVHPDVR
jgi:SpoVK/Ycf46/Vps4 family AAA+-type ATPase